MNDHPSSSRPLLVSCAALLLASCGGADVDATGAGKPRASVEPAPIERTPEPRSATQQPGLALPTEAPRDGSGPVLSVYVGGPAATIEAPRTVGAVAYATDVVVINTGEQPADVSRASVAYEAWRGDERIECTSDGGGPLDGPDTLEPSQAFTYRSEARCELDEPGVYEVRAYLDFGAEAPELRRESHHVARLEVEMPSSSP